MVFLMGVTSMEMVCEGLVKAGMDPQMPAAILQEGTSAVQRRVVATVFDLPQKAREANIQAPSVLIVGKVCALEKTLSWTQNRPLDGVRVVLTRPKELVSRMAHRLYELGAEVIELPAICLEPYAENPQLSKALSHISDYQWAAFTSITGVRVFFDCLQKNRCDLRAPFPSALCRHRAGHRKRAGTARHLRRSDCRSGTTQRIWPRCWPHRCSRGKTGAAAKGKARLGGTDRYAAGAGYCLHRHSALRHSVYKPKQQRGAKAGGGRKNFLCHLHQCLDCEGICRSDARNRPDRTVGSLHRGKRPPRPRGKWGMQVLISRQGNHRQPVRAAGGAGRTA